MKRLLSLSLFLMTAMLSFAHDFESGGIYYKITSSSAPYTVAVTYRGTSYSEYMDEYTGSVTIPDKVTYNGKTYSVTSIGDYAFWYCSGLTSITIPNSVTSHRQFAFMGDPSHPQQVTSRLGVRSAVAPDIHHHPQQRDEHRNSAFERLVSGLTSVTIPNSVTTIGILRSMAVAA